jgi:ZIP family zinc transporter
MFLGLSVGVMVYVSFAELLKSAIDNIGFFQSNLAFFSGIAFIMLLDFIVPHEYMEERVRVDEKDKKFLVAGLFTALGIAIHNFPEGMAVFLSSVKDTKLGISVAFAILIHNIPEGIAVAAPIYCATKSKRKAFLYSLAAGIAEPLGALAGILFLMPFLNQSVLYFSLAFVAGIMIFISFDELLPLSFEHENNHLAVLGVFLGMLIMALSLFLL